MKQLKMFNILKTASLVTFGLAAAPGMIELDVARVKKTLKTHHDEIYSRNIKYYTNDCLAAKMYVGSDK